MTTRDGVVLLDAPPTIGRNIQRAIDQVAAENGVSNKVTHLVYSHHHADHGGAFLPIHWGTFNLAIHPWSEPAETVLRLGTAAAVPLIMPKLGAPVEPAASNGVDPWWRAVSSTAPEPLAERDAPESTMEVERMID